MLLTSLTDDIAAGTAPVRQVNTDIYISSATAEEIAMLVWVLKKNVQRRTLAAEAYCGTLPQFIVDDALARVPVLTSADPSALSLNITEARAVTSTDIVGANVVNDGIPLFVSNGYVSVPRMRFKQESIAAIAYEFDNLIAAINDLIAVLNIDFINATNVQAAAANFIAALGALNPAVAITSNTATTLYNLLVHPDSVVKSSPEIAAAMSTGIVELSSALSSTTVNFVNVYSSIPLLTKMLKLILLALDTYLTADAPRTVPPQTSPQTESVATTFYTLIPDDFASTSLTLNETALQQMLYSIDAGDMMDPRASYKLQVTNGGIAPLYVKSSDLKSNNSPAAMPTDVKLGILLPAESVTVNSIRGCLRGGFIIELSEPRDSYISNLVTSQVAADTFRLRFSHPGDRTTSQLLATAATQCLDYVRRYNALDLKYNGELSYCKVLAPGAVTAAVQRFFTTETAPVYTSATTAATSSLNALLGSL